MKKVKKFDMIDTTLTINKFLFDLIFEIANLFLKNRLLERKLGIIRKTVDVCIRNWYGIKEIQPQVYIPIIRRMRKLNWTFIVHYFIQML